LGNSLGIVWVTDEEKCGSSLNDMGDLTDRLGIQDWEEEENWLLLEYERPSVPGDLHVPRTFDAIGMPHFRVETDCSAPCGRTVPLTRHPQEGLPEAVHRRCELARDQLHVDVRALQ